MISNTFAEIVFSLVICFLFSFFFFTDKDGVDLTKRLLYSSGLAVIGAVSAGISQVAFIVAIILAVLYFAGNVLAKIFLFKDNEDAKPFSTPLKITRLVALILSALSLVLIILSTFTFIKAELISELNLTSFLLFISPVFATGGSTFYLEKTKKDTKRESIGFTMFMVNLAVAVSSVLFIIVGYTFPIKFFVDPLISLAFFALAIAGLAMYAPTKTSINAFSVIALGLIIVSTVSYILFLDYFDYAIFSGFSVIMYMFICVAFDLVAVALLIVSAILAKKKATIV